MGAAERRQSHGNAHCPALPPVSSSAFSTCSGRARTAGAFRQVRPKDRAGGVDQELGRAGDVGVPRSSSGMKKIVAANHLSLRVGKKEKPKAKFLNLAAVDFRRVHADGGHTNAARVEIRKSLLKTP